MRERERERKRARAGARATRERDEQQSKRWGAWHRKQEVEFVDQRDGEEHVVDLPRRARS